ncbi:MAG: hypothetical protein WA790_20160 [Sulfitobacter sp.]
MANKTLFDLRTDHVSAGPRQLTAAELLANFDGLRADGLTSGPLKVTAKADATRGQAVVDVFLNETLIHRKMMTFADPHLDLNVAAGGAAAKGCIRLELENAPQFSAVTIDALATDSEGSHQLRGQVTTWAAKGLPVVGDYVRVLTSDLVALTTVRNSAANIAEMSFRSGIQVLASMTATQLSPTQIYPSDIIAGDVKIDQQAEIQLSIPTRSAPGMLVLHATYSNRTTPPTQISAAIAEWELPDLGKEEPDDRATS